MSDSAHQGCGGREDCFNWGAGNTATAGRVDPLLLLPAIAEPHTDHLLLHVQLVSDHGDLLRGRFLVLLEEDRNALSAWDSQRNFKHCSHSGDITFKNIVLLQTSKKSSAERFKYSNRRYFSPLKSSFLRPLWCWSRCWSSSCGGGWGPPCPAQGSQWSWGWTGLGPTSGSLHTQHVQTHTIEYKYLRVLWLMQSYSRVERSSIINIGFITKCYMMLWYIQQ